MTKQETSIDPAENLQKYSAPALENGLEILEFLSREIGTNLTDISKNVGKTTTSVFRMLAVLRKLGYVEYSTKYRLYRLSHKMFKISHQHTSVNNITVIALPIMQSLSQAINECCYLSMFSQGATLIIARQEPDMLSNRIFARVGSEGSLIDSSAGRIIMTFATDIEREEMIAAAKRVRDETIKKGALFKEIVSRITKQGYEQMPSPTLVGVVDFAFPIFNQLGQLAGTLSVSALEYKNKSAHLSNSELVNHIASAAEDISTELGYDLAVD